MGFINSFLFVGVQRIFEVSFNQTVQINNHNGWSIGRNTTKTICKNQYGGGVSHRIDATLAS